MGARTISIMELHEKFPDERSARDWLENLYWPDGRCCGHCGSVRTSAVKNENPMPYRCRDCRRFFSIRTGSSIQNSKLPLRTWVFATYFYVMHRKGISSVELAKFMEVTQKTAWFMLHRLREAWDEHDLDRFDGPVEVDETHVGGILSRMHAKDRRAARRMKSFGKSIVVGIRDRPTRQVRAKVVDRTDAETLQGFVVEHADAFATVYTDEARPYMGLPFAHETISHGSGEYVRGDVSTNGIESFWAIFKRAHKGIYHKFSPKHLGRYVREFCWRNNTRELGTLDRMRDTFSGLVGRRLPYAALIAPNGLRSGARAAARN